MGSNVNPTDIEDFLRGIRSSAYHAHGRPEYDFSDSRDNEPRWAPSVPTSAANLLGRNDDNDDDGEAYFNDDAHSEYTAVSTVTSHPYTVRSAAPPSIFSHQDDNDDDVRSIAQSTAPSLVGPYTGPTFVQQFFGAHTADFDPAPTQPGQALWCEFSTLLNCPALFRLDDEAGWIEHHEAHLGDPLPRKLMCWFCDDGHAPFEAARPRETRTNFVARMQHVREHILGDPYPWTSEHTRPDFYVVRHLWKSGLLSREVYEHAMTYDELPEVYRLPGWREHSHHHAQAPSSHRALDEARKERGQVHDLEKEKRAERRRLKEKLHHGSGGGGGGSSSSSRKRR